MLKPCPLRSAHCIEPFADKADCIERGCPALTFEPSVDALGVMAGTATKSGIPVGFHARRTGDL